MHRLQEGTTEIPAVKISRRQSVWSQATNSVACIRATETRHSVDTIRYDTIQYDTDSPNTVSGHVCMLALCWFSAPPGFGFAPLLYSAADSTLFTLVMTSSTSDMIPVFGDQSRDINCDRLGRLWYRARRDETASCFLDNVALVLKAENEAAKSICTDLVNTISARQFPSHHTRSSSMSLVSSWVLLSIEQVLEYILLGRTPTACIGLCSGLLIAAAVASSGGDKIALARSHGIEAIRLAFWIGIRCQTANFQGNCQLLIWTTSIDPNLLGDNLYVGVVTKNTCTVSGPSAPLLRLRSRLCIQNIRCRLLSNTVPYHSPYLENVLDKVIDDIRIRSIRLCHLIIPLYSNVNGVAFDKDISANVLAAEILTLPCRFDLVVDSYLSHTSPRQYFPSSEHLITYDDKEAILSQDVPTRPVTNDDIAIVGMACKLPGADDPEDFWKVMMDQQSTVEQIPSDRLDINEYHDPTGLRPNTMRTKWGNFMKHPFSFDAPFFKISPREAQSMDPQHRLALQLGYQAVEDAGCNVVNPERFGCYIGVANDDYTRNLQTGIDVYYSPGTLRTFLSGRLSYYFGWSGPNLTFDTACSSSLVAIHSACRSLREGSCDAILAGGVNLLTSPEMYLGLDRAHFLSPSGQCRPFDIDANGYCRSEGVAFYLLRRLGDAIRDNDNIHAVIRGSNVNHSGVTHSITHPSSESQTALFKECLLDAGVCPNDISYVEAHGPGTAAGDPVELRSIRSAFAMHRNEPLYVGSAKGNIGHTEATSGAVGLLKTILMFKYSTIPPQIGLCQLNPQVAQHCGSNIRITKSAVPWTGKFAAVNNFGASGNNATLIVERFSRPTRGTATEPQVVVFSAKSRISIESLFTKYRRHSIQASIQDIAYTLSARRFHHPYRAAFVIDDIKAIEDRPTIAHPTSLPTIAFVFSGQGGYYHKAGEELYQKSETFRNVIDLCEGILLELRFPSLKRTHFEANETSQDETAQIATFCIQVAIARVYQLWGFKVSSVIGHSIGEYAACVVAGVLSLEDALYLVCHRARLMFQHCARGTSGLLAVNNTQVDLPISCYNTTQDVVVGASIDELVAERTRLAKNSIKSTLLDVPFAFHSTYMEPVREAFESIANKVQYKEPQIPIASNVYGTIIQPGQNFFSAKYFVDHCIQPVRFAECLQATDVDVFLEIGLHPICLGMIKKTHPTALAAPTLKKYAGWESILNSLRALYLQGADLDWLAYHRDISSSGRVISLPSYCFDETVYFTPLPNLSNRQHILPLLHVKSQASGLLARYHTHCDKVSALIRGHTVSGKSLCPASLYTEMALEAAKDLSLEQGIQNFKALHPFVYDEEEGSELCLEVNHDGHFSISVGNSPTLATGEFCNMSNLDFDVTASICLVQDTHDVKMSQDMIYQLFDRVVGYDQTYWGIHSIMIRGYQAYAKVLLPPPSDAYVVHPRLQDSLIQPAGFVANTSCNRGEAFILHQIDSIFFGHLDPRQSFDVYTCLTVIDDRDLAADIFIMQAGSNVGLIKGARFRKLRMSMVDSLLCTSSKTSTPSLTTGSYGKRPLDVVAECFGLSSVNIQTSATLESLGADSLMKIELLAKLKASFPDYDLQKGDLNDMTTVSQLLTMLDESSLGSETSTLADFDSKRQEDTLYQEMLTLFRTRDLDPTIPLEEYGLDSLMTIELKALLHNTFSASLPQNINVAQLSFNMLCDILKDKTVLSQPDESHRSLMEAFQMVDNPTLVQNGQGPPLVLVHDGSGTALAYHAMTSVDRRLYGIHDSEFFKSNASKRSIQEMAIKYSEMIERPEGVLFGGWSMGGVVAYEMAMALSLRGVKVGGVVLIDSPCPPRAPALNSSTIRLAINGLHHGRAQSLVEQAFERNGQAMSTYVVARNASFPVVLIRAMDGMQGDDIPEWLSDRKSGTLLDLGWNSAIHEGLIKIIDVPGHHFNLFQSENVLTTSQAIQEACLAISQFVIAKG